MRIIAAATNPGHWMAWTTDAPQTGYGGPTPQTAIKQLCDALGRHPDTFRFVPSRSNAHRFVLDELPGEPCPDCGGSGRYVGFNVVETCRTCGGLGRA